MLISMRPSQLLPPHGRTSVAAPFAVGREGAPGSTVFAEPHGARSDSRLKQKALPQRTGGIGHVSRVPCASSCAEAPDLSREDEHNWTYRARGRVSQQMVLGLVHTIAAQPLELSRDQVDALLDRWGAGALQFLRGIHEEEMPEYGIADYMMRYIKRRFNNAAAADATVHNDEAERALRGTGCVRMALTNAGWPAAKAFPTGMSMYLIAKRPLVSPWMQAEFARHVTEGLDRGRILIGHALWPGHEEHASSCAQTGLVFSSDVPRYPNIGRDRVVLLKSVYEGHMRNADYIMLLRAAAELGKEIVPRKKPGSTKPSWWRLAASPFSAEAASSYLRDMRSMLNMPGYAVRLISRDRLRWMRMESGMMARMEFAPSSERAVQEWGVIGEGENGEEAHFVRARAEEVLRFHGTKL